MELSEIRMAIYKSNFTSEEYIGLIDIIQETQTMNAKAKISIGDDVWVVQKTKRSKGVVTKIAIKNSLILSLTLLIQEIIHIGAILLLFTQENVRL